MSFEESGIKKIKEKLSKGPCLVAQLGTLLAEDEKPQGKLREALSRFGIETQFGRDHTEVYAYLSGQESLLVNATIKDNITLKRQTYRFAVLQAFSKILQPGEAIYLIIHPKIKYIIAPEEDDVPVDKHTILIEDEYRMPGAKLINQNNHDQNKIFTDKLDLWCKKHNVSKEILIWNQPLNPSQMKEDLATLLRDFIDAQPRDIRSKVNLPGSIIQALLSRFS